MESLINKVKLFVDYKTALRLKRLGYNEKAESMYVVIKRTGGARSGIDHQVTNSLTWCNGVMKKLENSYGEDYDHCSRPLFVDVFEYFERKYKLSYILTPTVGFKKIYKIVGQYIQILDTIENPYYGENDVINKMMDIVEQRGQNESKAI